MPKTFADPKAIAEIERLELLRKDLAALQIGDLVQHADGQGYVVIDNHNGRPIAVRTIEVTNPYEWTIIKRHGWRP